MSAAGRRELDVTGEVDVTSADAVCAAVLDILRGRYGRGLDEVLVRRLFTDFERLYRGEYPGFFPVETPYHDLRHVLDVTLAAARLIDGYDASQPPQRRLGPALATLGVALALFHDAGYIRRRGDRRHRHGAEYTRVHVSRSARFLAEYLPTIGLGDEAGLAAKLVHYTGYEFDPRRIALAEPRLHVLGALVGSADVMAQMADDAYLEKCRDHLFAEFELGGVARQVDENGREQVRYASPQDLLRQTPEFIRRTLEERLDGLFGGLHRCFCAHFGGGNPYLDAVQRNRRRLERLLAGGKSPAF